MDLLSKKRKDIDLLIKELDSLPIWEFTEMMNHYMGKVPAEEFFSQELNGNRLTPESKAHFILKACTQEFATPEIDCFPIQDKFLREKF